MQPDPANPMLAAPVGKALVAMSTPISLGMLSTFLFQVVDTGFVGQIGPDELAALSFAAPTYLVAVTLLIGLATGLSALVGTALGAERPAEARRHTTVAVLTGLAGTTGLAALGLLGLDPWFALMGAPPELRPLIAEYMRWLYPGLPLLSVGLVGGAALRAAGHVKAPEVVMGLAGLINVGLDATLIFGLGPAPALGLSGAAIATVCAWAFVAVAMSALLLRHRLLTARPEAPRAALAALLRLSSPAIATQVLLPATVLLVTWLVSSAGPEAVAAYGVAQRLEMLLMVGISAVSVALVPFVSQNVGAQQRDRVEEAIVFAGRAAFAWGALLFVVLLVAAEPLAAAFTDDAAIAARVRDYFALVALSYGPYGIVIVTASVFNGVQRPGLSLRVLAVKSLVFTAPIALLGAHWGPEGVFVALALGNALGALYAGRVLRRMLRACGSALAHRRARQDYAQLARRIVARLAG